MFKIIVLALSLAVVLSISACRPAVLGDNAFLSAFVSHELLAMLVVMITITFASVANIHLSINRVIAATFSDNPAKGEASAKPLRSELNQNAWLLFALFPFEVVVLFVKGALPKEPTALALTHGVSLVVLLASVLILYDIYRVAFALVASEPKLTPAAPSAQASTVGDG